MLQTFVSLLMLSSFALSAQAAPEPKPSSPKHGSVILTRAVGEVGERVVTSREVLIEEGVQQALDGRATTDGDLSALGNSEKALPAAVTKVLDEWSIFLEAKALSSKPVSKPEIATAIKQVQEKWSGQPSWTSLEVSGEELRDVVERHLIATEFEKLKSDPALAPVSDDDALAYYRKNRSRFGSLPFSEIEANIKSFLVKQQTEHRLAEWRDVLRRKYKVRNFIAG